MSNSTDQTLPEEHGDFDQIRNPNATDHQNDQSHEWEKMAQAWVSSFPEAKPVSAIQVEEWIDSNHGSLPAELQSRPRAELIDRLLSIQHYMRSLDQGEGKDYMNMGPPARFQRTDQWLPVYSWLESINQDEVVKSKEISDWLAANPDVRDQLCSRHSRYHLMHYIKKCHIKILKRKEKRVSQPPSKEETASGAQKDVIAKPLTILPNNPLNNIPKDSDLYVAKRNEALQKYKILVELEKRLAPIVSKPQDVNN